MNLLESKKGQVGILLRNYIIVLVILFVFGLSSIFGFYLWFSFDESFQTTGLYDIPEVKNSANAFTFALSIPDYIIVLMMVGFLIGIGITTFKLNTPPIFFIVMVTMAVFLGVISYFFNFIFAQIVSQTVFDGVRLYFSRTILLCTNLHWVSLANIIIGSLTTYAKREQR